MPLKIGDTFAGYRVLRLLGSGGMGEVYLVQHPRLPRQEALKALRPEFSHDESFRERFIREADLASGLRHPHIVGIHDRGEHDGQLWIAMDFIDGTDLSRLLAERYPAGMPLGHVVTIVTAVASALDYANKKGLLHRDIKPANIIVADLDTDDPKVFLADFGIARPIDDTSGITTTNMTVGTVAYAAPEQLMGEQMDGRADQYTLAATTYHLLTGSQLFPNSNPAVVISRHLNAPAPILADARPELGQLDPVLAAALAKEPSDRFPSCSALAQALKVESSSLRAMSANAVTQSAPPPHRSAPPPYTGSPAKTIPGSPRTLIVLGSIAAIILLVGGVALAWHRWDSRGTSAAGSTSSTRSTAANTPVPSPSAAAAPAPPPGVASPADPTKTAMTTPAISTAGFFGEWGRHSMAVTLAPDGSAYYKVWSGAANGTTWSATWSTMTSTSAMVVLATQSESHGEIDYSLHRYPGEAFTFTLQSGGYATITTPSGQPVTLCPRGAGFRDSEGLCGA